MPVGLPNPLAVLTGRIQDKSIRRAFEEITRDAATPWEIDFREVDVLLRSATHDDPRTLGKDSTLPQELADLELIRSEGAWLLRSPAAMRAFDAALEEMQKLPKITWRDNDAGLRTAQVALNKALISGRAKGDTCPPNARCFAYIRSKVAIEVDGEIFAVDPRAGEGAASIARRLVAALKEGGYRAKVEAGARGSSVVAVLGKKDELRIKSLTTDRMVAMRPQGHGQVLISAGIGGPIELGGGQIGLQIEGRAFTVRTRRGGDAGEALTELASLIKAAGYELDRTGLPTIDSIEEAWFIRKAGAVGQYSPGSWIDLKGQIITYDEAHPPPSGGAPAYGNWMVLDKPIKVGDVLATEVYLGGTGDYEVGSRQDFSGRLDVREGAQEIFPPPRYVVLSGRSDLTKGEPRFDGRSFYSSESGKTLPVLSWYPPFVADVPTNIFVVDQGSDKIFRGGMGGFIPAERNPFHGFRESAAIREVTQDDISEIKYENNQLIIRATGRPLVKVGDEGQPPPGSADVPFHEWYLDPKGKKLYRFSSGDIAPPYDPEMTQVAELKALPFSDHEGPIGGPPG